mmetsp:Transcript_3686/g.10425  ORF Transcript_3686/g.10425 Transcript_3686/m.10425 type:complete len:225 (-) Transcript_3686:914-1588(-)
MGLPCRQVGMPCRLALLRAQVPQHACAGSYCLMVCSLPSAYASVRDHFCTSLYPRMAISSGAFSPFSSGTSSHPLLLSRRPSILTTVFPQGLSTRAPSSSRFFKLQSPSTTRLDVAEMEPPFTFFMSSNHVVAKEGARCTCGPRVTGMPRGSALGPYSTFMPARRSISALALYISASPVDALSGGVPAAAFLAASSTLFLTGLKHSHLSICVKPTLDPEGRSLG